MTPFTLMSFNIEGSYYERGENSWPFRAQLNIETIKKYNPDLIGFQEVQRGNIDAYAAQLSGYHYNLGALTARENQSGEGYHCAIYWKAERFQLLESGLFYLNEDPARYGLAWGTEQGRTCNWVRLRDRADGAEYLHINTHLHHDSHEGRIASARIIVERLPGLIGDAASVLMTADFNARSVPMQEAWLHALEGELRERLEARRAELSDNEVYRIFTGAGFRDAWREAGNVEDAATNTYHGYHGAAFPHIGMRIDWILVRDGSVSLRVESSQIVTDAAPPLYPSDHYPVVAHFV